ncbi:MAG TPA: phage tail protein [Clostridia bacterium]
MANDTVKIDTRQLDRLTNELKGFEKEVAEAAKLALNRSIDYTITQTTRFVTRNYSIKSADIKKSFDGGIKKTSRSDLTATITSKGHTLSFAHFPYTPKNNIRAKKSNIRAKKSIFSSMVMVNIIKSKGKIVSRKGFVASTGATSQDKTQFNVFKRLGKARLPIATIRTLSIPQMITNEKVGPLIQKAAQEKFDERLEHEIIRAMTKIERNVR